MKVRKARRYPLVLMTIAAASATSAALYYRWRLDEKQDCLLQVPEVHLEEVAQGAKLTHWIDSNGIGYFKTDFETNRV